MTWDPTTSSALAGLAARKRRCGIHGDDTSDGRCASCDQLAADAADDAEERWYALHDGWVR